jgi:ComF family protein
MFLTHLFYDALLAVAYPQRCAICGGSVESRKFGVACEACWKRTRIFTGRERLCWKCGAFLDDEVLPISPEEVRCGRCETQCFNVARAVGSYKGALRESVLQLKRQPQLAPHLEALLITAAQREPLSLSTRIVPVPLHSKRQRSRGFNQAAVIAEVLSKGLRLPLDEVSVERVSLTEQYRAGLDAKGRRDTVADAFSVVHPKLIADENILLVDDVFTTGATVSACAAALLAAGAQHVFVLTISRASL